MKKILQEIKLIKKAFSKLKKTNTVKVRCPRL